MRLLSRQFGEWMLQRANGRWCVGLCVGVAAWLGECQLIGEGLRNPPAGAFSLGRAGGRIAQIDDASAVTHNPANLVDLSKPEVEVASTIVDLEWSYKSAALGHQTAETKDNWKFLPNFFASAPLTDQQLALGLGVTTPYGLCSTWDTGTDAFARPTGILRYQTPYAAQLTAINFNPSLALRLGDHVQLGAGFDVMWSELTLRQYYPWFLATGNLADPDGTAKAKGDGLGYGANVGLTFNLAKRHRFAVTYRSPITVSYEGNFSLDHVPAALGGRDLHTDFASSIEFPTIVAAGYGYQLTETIRLEADVEWLQFSNFDRLPLRLHTPPPGIPASVPEDWRNTFTLGLGGDWQFSPGWTLRASYQYYQSPVPDSTFSPTLVDANQNVVTMGLRYRVQRHTLELAYSPVFYEDRHIRNSYNPAYNGDYEVTVHLISLAYHFTF